MRIAYKKLWSIAVVAPLLALGLWTAPSVAASAPAAEPAALTAAQAQALSRNVTNRVIIVLKDQAAQAPASRATAHLRSQIIASDQHGILAELGSTKSRNVHSYTLINAVAATVSSGEEARLAANPAVAEVVPDQIIHLASPTDAAPTTTPAAGHSSAANASCPSASQPPLLEPQAISDIGADSSNPSAKTARSLGIDGSGVTVAWIADGLDTQNQDFIRSNGQSVFVDYKDFSGEGTNVPTGGVEAFLDSSSIAAQGTHTYDISGFSNLGPTVPCRIRIEGVAPGANLVGLDIFGAEDAGFNSSFLQAIDYAVSTDHVNVLNESLGNNYYPDDAASLDLIKAANDAAVAAGTTVTVSSGDAGVTDTIGTPSTDPKVISAGASTTYQTPLQLGYGGAQFPGVTGYLNNNISALSSSGFDQAGQTISLVAPGEINWILCSTNQAMYGECANFLGQPTPIDESGGTSESAPLTAGTAALVIQAYEKTHGGAAPSPALVKQILTSTADDIQAPADEQGAGLLDAYRAVVAAESYQAPEPANTENTLLESTSQFNAVAHAGTTQRFTERLTNLGDSAQTVSLSSRTLGAYRLLKTKTVTLSDTTSPQSVDYQGFTDNYAVVHFHVPSGVDRLNGAIAFVGSSSALSSRVRLALVDPDGRLADYSLPQGVGNYGDAQVAEPMAGEWTAYIWSRDTAGGGTTGPVVFGASVARFGSFGTLDTSTLTIPSGGTKSVNLTVQTPSTPGDVAGSLVVGVPGQPSITVPVTVRTLVPSGPVSVAGVLTGGNGRSSFTGQTEYYQVDVPGGRAALNASVTLADNPNNQTYVWLIDPSGQAQAFQSNTLVTQDSSGNLSATSELGANAHVVDPEAGRWTVIVQFSPTVSGTALSEGYTLAVNETHVPVTAHGVPRGATVSAAHPAVVTIKVKNNSTAPEAYFVDARLNQLAQYQLPAINSPEATVPLSVTGNIPVYLAPSGTVELDASAATSGATPIQFDMSAPTGDPDVVSGQGPSVAASLTGNPFVTAGEYAVVPDVVGASGTTGPAPETVDTSLVATTLAFDPSITSGTGDMWLAAVGGPLTVSPVVVPPGGTATIPVIMTPNEPSGTTVSGTLYLDDDSLFSLYGGLAPDANTLAAIPYSYTVG